MQGYASSWKCTLNWAGWHHRVLYPLNWTWFKLNSLHISTYANLCVLFWLIFSPLQQTTFQTYPWRAKKWWTYSSYTEGILKVLYIFPKFSCWWVYRWLWMDLRLVSAQGNMGVLPPPRNATLALLSLWLLSRLSHLLHLYFLATLLVYACISSSPNLISIQFVDCIKNWKSKVSLSCTKMECWPWQWT